MTRVVNIYHKVPYDVYCGRAGRDPRTGEWHDGYFGNPFEDGTREENVAAFREYFYQRIKTDREYCRRVMELKDKVLACFCKPKACHCDIYAEWLDGPGYAAAVVEMIG